MVAEVIPFPTSTKARSCHDCAFSGLVSGGTWCQAYGEEILDERSGAKDGPLFEGSDG